MPVRIPLSKGKYFALVDEADAPAVLRYSWWRIPGGSTSNFYAEGVVDGKRIRMHRFILGAEAAKIIDHRDGDGLNNTRLNMRPCTDAQNAMNRTRLSKLNTSGVIGVGRSVKGEGWWRVTMRAGGKSMYLGDYEDFAYAAGVRRQAELDHFGEFAPLNSIWEPRPRIRRRIKKVKLPRIKKVRPVKLTLAEKRQRKAEGRAELKNFIAEFLQDDLGV